MLRKRQLPTEPNEDYFACHFKVSFPRRRFEEGVVLWSEEVSDSPKKPKDTCQRTGPKAYRLCHFTITNCDFIVIFSVYDQECRTCKPSRQVNSKQFFILSVKAQFQEKPALSQVDVNQATEQPYIVKVR